MAVSFYKSMSYERSKMFNHPPNMTSLYMADARRLMTRLSGSFNGMDSVFMVDQDHNGGTELYDVFYSKHFLSAVEKAVLDEYPQCNNKSLNLQFSPGATGLSISQRECLADQSVSVFMFSKHPGELIGVVSKNKLRHTALQFLTADAYSLLLSNEHSKL